MVTIAAAQPAMNGRFEPNPWHAVADLYHAYFTGLIMTLVTRRSPADAAEFVFRVFRRQHHERFLPGLTKLGLDKLPHPVAAAQYHYLSNFIGGVSVEYMYESDRKAWVRYPPPRWIWKGTAICAIPSEVSAAMLRGWHAHNGVSLKNPRMGFVCTKQTVDGENGLEGFYYEYDRDLQPEERLRFEPGLEAPLFDIAEAPALGGNNWPKARLDKAYRNYAMEYVRTGLPVAAALFGSDAAAPLLHTNGKLVGMQLGPDIAPHLGGHGEGAEGFANLLVALIEAQGDEASLVREAGKIVIVQKQWGNMAGLADYDRSCLSALSGMVDGLAASIGRRISVHLEAPSDQPGPLRWVIGYGALKPHGNDRYPA